MSEPGSGSDALASPPVAGDPVALKPRRRFLPRFSLRTLTLCVLLFASAFGLWWKWAPWTVQWSSGEDLARGTVKGFSPTGEAILTTQFSTPILWNAKDGRLQQGFARKIPSVGWTEFALDGSCIYRVEGLSRSFLVWNARDGKSLELKKRDAFGYERLLGITNGVAVLTLGTDSNPEDKVPQIRCVDLETKVDTFWKEGSSFCLERRGKALAVLTNEQTIEIYRIPKWERIAQLEPAMSGEEIMMFDLEASRMMLRDKNDVLNVYDVESGSVLSTIDAGRLEGASHLSSDASLLYVRSYDQAKVNFCDTQSGKVLWSTDDSQTRYHRFSFSPDSQTLAVTEFEGDTNNPEWTRIVASRTGKVLAELAPADGHYVNAIYSPTEMRILAEEADGTLTMWERRRPEQWWGLAWVPEFWLTVVFALLALWSLVRDFKTLRRANRSGASSV